MNVVAKRMLLQLTKLMNSAWKRIVPRHQYMEDDWMKGFVVGAETILKWDWHLGFMHWRSQQRRDGSAQFLLVQVAFLSSSWGFFHGSELTSIIPCPIVSVWTLMIPDFALSVFHRLLKSFGLKRWRKASSTSQKGHHPPRWVSRLYWHLPFASE